MADIMPRDPVAAVFREYGNRAKAGIAPGHAFRAACSRAFEESQMARVLPHMIRLAAKESSK